MCIKTKKLNDGAKVPFRATPGSAGADLCACLEADVVIASGERLLIPTGLAVEIPIGYGGFMFARSSLGKQGVSLANGVGVIDSDYRGEIGMLLFNHGSEPFIVKNGDRIAQLVILPVCAAEFITVDNLAETERGEGGFGSTGKN
ncbi:MAG: dUTP diphosphatase [Oscillospiraceae bacterium]|jgi:dUTP pyrophosphatase|nr:dUTP diphosphatase [Oscillospiraceae bacterium]